MKFTLSTIALALAMSQATFAKPTVRPSSTWAVYPSPSSVNGTVSGSKTRTRPTTTWAVYPSPSSGNGTDPRPTYPVTSRPATRTVTRTVTRTITISESCETASKPARSRSTTVPAAVSTAYDN
ncbi:hypothetical protein BGZ82_000479 [Podila clonocystis]|nr:hypothetical protein BGZ82_000479 [Podila clonocystis]